MGLEPELDCNLAMVVHNAGLQLERQSPIKLVCDQLNADNPRCMPSGRLLWGDVHRGGTPLGCRAHMTLVIPTVLKSDRHGLSWTRAGGNQLGL